MKVMASAAGGLKEKNTIFWGDENGSLLCKGVAAVYGAEKENSASCFSGVHCDVLIRQLSFEVKRPTWVGLFLCAEKDSRPF